MRGIGRNRVFILVFLTLLLATIALLSSLPGSPLHVLTSPISIVLKPVHQAVTQMTDRITGFFESINEGMRLREENKKLVEENARLRNQIAQLEEAGRQYEALKEAFLLKDRYDQLTFIGARVLTREIGPWFDVFQIDVGKADGISVTETRSYAVVNAESHLIGRVLSSDLVSAKVLPLTHEGFSVSARVDVPGGSLMRLRGSLDLKEEGCCLADQIPATATIKPGDVLITSGLGGLFPAGILIGTVIEVQDAATPSQRQAVIKPFASLEQITTVFVIKETEP